MKKFLPILSLAFVMVACTTQPKEEAPAAPTVGIQLPAFNPDTVGLAAYQQWKAQNELAARQPQMEQPAKVVYVQAAAPVAKVAKKQAAKPAAAPRAKAPSAGSNSPAPVSNNDGVAIADESVNEAKAPEKEGWSKAAKGAAIGTTAGAAAGAIIGKNNRVLGGVIGGVVGGAVGYGVGRKMDKKDGRY